jgi:hypothetical protein
MNLTYFGIRVKGTEKFFLRSPDQRRGYSWDEPEEPTQNKPVRLFPSKKSAQNALAQWRRGKHIHKVSSQPQSYLSIDGYDEEWVDIEVVPERKTAEIEIVSLRLTAS